MHSQDIMARRTFCEEQLKLRNLALEAASDGIFITGAMRLDHPVVYANPALERLTGTSIEDILGLPAHRLLESWDSDLDLAPIRAAFGKGEAASTQLRLMIGRPSCRWCMLRLSPVPQPSGTPVRFVGVLSDITGEKEQSIHLRRFMKRMPDGMLVTTDEGTILDANPAAARLFACSTVNLRGRRVDDLITETGGPRQTRRRSGLALKATMAPFAARGRCLDGSGIDLMVLVNEMRVGDAHIYVHVLHDISRREQMAAELRREQEFSDTVLETLNSLVVVLDSQGRIVRFNKACERLTGYRFAEVRGRTVWEFLLLPEEVEAVQRETQRLLDKNLTHRFENHWVTRDGRRRLIRWSASYLTGPGEEVEYIIGTGIDITKQVQAQKSLLRSEERLKLTLEAVEDALWDWSIETDELHFSPRWASMLGYSSQELPPRFATFCDLLHPDDAQEVEIGIRRCLSEPDSRFEQEFRLRTRSGEYQWMVGRAKVMERSADGRPQRMLGTCTDITRRKKVEEQLLRAQKMEAVGQLAGGMAHDFNNMLSVITGCLELLEDSLTDKGSRRDPLQLMRMAHGAAQKGARLVKKMLAFSRQQTLEPKVCDLNRLVEGVSDLLHRSLGENIEIELALQRALWKTRVDAGQLENALINLAVNSRDAMPNGGKLTIETSNVELDDLSAFENCQSAHGRYVLVAVTDNGTGMSRQVLKRATEPFFTTKSAAKGTGLGLSMVYGFMQQSGGHIRIYSEEGRGTTVKLFLPCSILDQEQALEEESQEYPTGTETILLVEDDHGVRMVVGAALEELGYTVLEAEDGTAALGFVRDNPDQRIDLLLTDTVMSGGMDGISLARALLELRSGTPVLFTSGFADYALRRNNDLARSFDLISKPYRRWELARKIRQVLDRRPGQETND